MSPYLVSMLARLNQPHQRWTTFTLMPSLPPATWGNYLQLHDKLNQQMAVKWQRQAPTVNRQITMGPNNTFITLYQMDTEAINRYFSLNTINSQLTQLQEHLESYITRSEKINALPKSVLTPFVTNAKKILQLDGGRLAKTERNSLKRNLSLLSHSDFVSIIKQRRILSRFNRCHESSLAEPIDNAFSWWRLALKAICNPWYYLFAGGLHYFRLRLQVKLFFDYRLARFTPLIQQALDSNIDNFLHRWLYCTTPSDVAAFSTYEQTNLVNFLSDPLVQSALVKKGMLTREVKALLLNAPLAAFELMVNVMAERNSEQVELDKVASSNQTEPPYDNVNVDEPVAKKVDALITLTQSLYTAAVAKASDGKKSALLDGLLRNATSRGALYPKAKRLKKLSSYVDLVQSVFSEVQALSVDIKQGALSELTISQRREIEVTKQHLFVYFHQHLAQLQQTREGADCIDGIKIILKSLSFGAAKVTGAKQPSVASSFFENCLVSP